MSNNRKTHILCILDGFGYREDLSNNSITPETAPFFHELLKTYPHALLKTDGEEVGLPAGQMGNSEVGHISLGAGRTVYQDLPKITRAVENGELANNPQLKKYIADLKASKGKCHLMGLVSDGGIHSHEDHIIALAQIIAKEGVEVVIHLILDGRDTPPQSAINTVPGFINKVTDGFYNIKIASICGRYYVMDRDKNWERIEKAYSLYTQGKGVSFESAVEALQASYNAGKDDEFVEPVVLNHFELMQDGDGLLMANFRADRARQILTTFVDPDFDGFKKEKTVSFNSVLGMVEYSDHLNKFIPAIFPAEILKDTLGEVVSRNSMMQLRIAETEKYAHVTYFFNGGSEAVFEGETRILVPSPKVATYDMQPEMSAPEVTDKLIGAIESGDYDLIVVNYANGDMVGHTGNLEAAKKAVQTLDDSMCKVVGAVKETGSVMLLTADHGNCEEMHDHSTNGAHTAHTLNLVPVVLINADKSISKINNGSLVDVAPTLLKLLNLDKPLVMSGKNLLA